MANVQVAPSIWDELADLFVSVPTQEQILKFRPSNVVQERARYLLARQGEMRLTDAEQHELDEFVHAEMFMRLVKARLRAVVKGASNN